MKLAGKIAGTAAVAAAALGTSAVLSPSYAQFVDGVHYVGAMPGISNRLRR